ncbi:paired amphipathic helix [Xylogone sp. PMI_703]|nr:paired amphipathic helix [Xylogone sp. PMI_703]
MEKAEFSTASDSPACLTDQDKLNRTIAFILDVQARFEPERKETYQSFLDSFTEYQAAIASTDSISNKTEMVAAMREKVAHILKDEPDLFAEFESFFPKEVEEAL